MFAITSGGRTAVLPTSSEAEALIGFQAEFGVISDSYLAFDLARIEDDFFKEALRGRA